MIPQWPVTVQTLHENLHSIETIVTRWRERFANEDWLNELDNSSEAERVAVLEQYVNEMKVVASYAATIVEVVK